MDAPVIPAPTIRDRSLETELKFVLPSCRTPLAIRFLQRLCDPDPDFPAGIVSSIYFDSRDWDYLGEKRNSDYLKTKVRLRWYERPHSDSRYPDRSFAEIKARTGSRRVKLRVPTEYAGATLAAMDLHDPELLRVPALLQAAGAPVRQDLFPAFVVRYARRRYIEKRSRSRIAIDYAITAPKANKLMLCNPFPCELPQTVLEVKGAGHTFPPQLQSAFKLGFRKAAFSKYFECYRYLTRTFF